MAVRKQVISHHWRPCYVQGWLLSAVTQKHPMAERGDGHLDLERAFGQSVIQPRHLHIFLQFSPQSAQQSFRFSHFSLKKKLFQETQQEKASLNRALIVQLIIYRLGNTEVRGLCMALTLSGAHRYREICMCIYTHTDLCRRVFSTTTPVKEFP